ncbi:ABC transporter ATP-binding protein/permease [Sedimentimonas flavescens]|uniref:ABC transporter ATP-binding protein/permease n=1 Tax=Sedimentimonas flavescens TaxID=2851012 RepID=A0ABT2ZV77_9RHOB|nr:ABC transporter ATP-binding protein [Sedimentimonas flavescens]MCV2877657.1 ABC transporter ATP-binding protein/permease [Sedimentimonas flavescens]
MTLRFLFGLMRPFWLGLLIVMCLMLLESVALLALPALGGRLGAIFLDQSAQPVRREILLTLVLGLLIALAALRMGSRFVYAAVSQSLLAKLRLRLMDHIQRLPIAFHQSGRRGDLIALLTEESARLGTFISETLVSVPPMILTALGATILMMRIDLSLLWLVPVLVPLFFIVLRIVGRFMRRLGEQLQREHAHAIAIAEETLEMLPVIKSFNREAQVRQRYADQTEVVRRLELRRERLFGVLEPVIALTVTVSATLLLYLAGSRLSEGQIETAELVSLLLYVAVLVRPVGSLALLYGQFRTAQGSLSRLQSVLGESPEQVEQSDKDIHHLRGDIRFEGVSFSYPANKTAVTGLSFHIRPGEVVAITGDNGAGKSTAVGLLLGFFRPDAGRIVVDDVDTANLSLSTLRRAVGYVPQTRHLMDGSIRDNIRFFDAELSQAQIERAARIAQAHDFISALPKGYDTLIGDKGVRLSGGQQQRLALARALVNDPPILVLDEATSMYDIEGEHAFVEEITQVLQGRTVILITHRPASLKLADRILRMAHGRVVSDEVGRA